MKNILKKITAMVLAAVMLFTLSPIAFAGVEYSVEDAYAECAQLYPEFIQRVIDEGGTEAEIISLLKTIQRYLLALDVEVTEDNLEEHMVGAIKYASGKLAHLDIIESLTNAFPEAVASGMDGEIHPDFVPIVETIKRIIFEHGLAGGDNQDKTEPTDNEPTEPKTEEPTEEKTEPSTEEPTEPATEATAPSGGNEGSGNTGSGNTGSGNTGGGNTGGGNVGKEEPSQKPTERPADKTFSDMKDALWAQEAVYSLVDSGVINGYPDKTFKPNNPVTRAEFAKMIVLISGRYAPYKETYTSTFTDVSAKDWHYPYVSAALKFGFIKGRDEKIFDPNSNITRADLCLIVYRYIKSINPEFKAKTNADGTPFTFVDMATVPVWDVEAVNALYSNDIASLRDVTNNKFEPLLPATRAECASILYKAANAALNINVK